MKKSVKLFSLFLLLAFFLFLSVVSMAKNVSATTCTQGQTVSYLGCSGYYTGSSCTLSSSYTGSTYDSNFCSGLSQSQCTASYYDTCGGTTTTTGNEPCSSFMSPNCPIGCTSRTTNPCSWTSYSGSCDFANAMCGNVTCKSAAIANGIYCYSYDSSQCLSNQPYCTWLPSSSSSCSSIPDETSCRSTSGCTPQYSCLCPSGTALNQTSPTFSYCGGQYVTTSIVPAYCTGTPTGTLSSNPNVPNSYTPLATNTCGGLDKTTCMNTAGCTWNPQSTYSYNTSCYGFTQSQCSAYSSQGCYDVNQTYNYQCLPTSLCSDTDGNYPYIPGTATLTTYQVSPQGYMTGVSTNSPYPDQCSTRIELTEYYCSSGTFGGGTLGTNSGYICSNGCSSVAGGLGACSLLAPSLTPYQTSIYVSVQQVSGATSYNVFRNGTLIKTVPSGASYYNTGLNCGTTYSYQAQACGGSNNACGPLSATAVASTTSCGTSCPSATIGTGNAGCSSSPIQNAQLNSSYLCPSSQSCYFCNPGFTYNGTVCLPECPLAQKGTVYTGFCGYVGNPSNPTNAYNNASYYCSTVGQQCYLCNSGYTWDGSACVPPSLYFAIDGSGTPSQSSYSSSSVSSGIPLYLYAQNYASGGTFTLYEKNYSCGFLACSFYNNVNLGTFSGGVSGSDTVSSNTWTLNSNVLNNPAVTSNSGTYNFFFVLGSYTSPTLSVTSSAQTYYSCSGSGGGLCEVDPSCNSVGNGCYADSSCGGQCSPAPVNKSQCASVSFCTDYTSTNVGLSNAQSWCNADVNGVGGCNVSLATYLVDYGSNPPAGVNAFCSWNSAAGACGLGTSGGSAAQGTGVSCQITQNPVSEDCSNSQLINSSWTAQIVWDNNTYTNANCNGVCSNGICGLYGTTSYHCLPNGFSCESGSAVIPCPAQVQLSFFDWQNAIVAVLIIFVLYILFEVKAKRKKTFAIRRKTTKRR